MSCETTLKNSIQIIGLVNTQLVDPGNEFIISFNGTRIQSYSVRIAPFLLVRMFAGKVKLFSLQYWKRVAIALVRVYPRYRPVIHRRILIDIPEGIFNLNSLNQLKIEAIGREIVPFVTRELALDGFMPSYLDLNLDYELRKNWELKELIFAFSSIRRDSKRRIHHYITSLTDRRSMCPGTSSVPIGEFEFKTLRNATVLHGQIIINKEYYFPTDSMKLPPDQSIARLPTINWAGPQGKVFYPKTSISLEPMQEAIFIGGTNNWMHFVIEDLPRLMILRHLNINPNVPILIRADLSSQIKEAVSFLSSRKVIEINKYVSVEVAKIYYFFLNNALPAAMRGDYINGQKLFNPEIVKEAAALFTASQPLQKIKHERILIARERNLFRPMSNFVKLRQALESDLGFRTLFLGGMSFQEIAKVFSTAEIVVAEYGAGLANVVFTPPRAKIVELRGPYESNAIEYEVLVKALGHEHFKVLGSRRFLSSKGIGNGQFCIDVDLLKKVVGRIIEST
jgi:hypothetical protein